MKVLANHSKRGFALILLGPVVADIRGSIKGTVFSRNAAGAIARGRTVPTYPASSKQVAVAARMSTVVDDWQNTLTTAQRDRWNALAAHTSLPNKLGQMFTPSGMNLYIKSNLLLLTVGYGMVVVPPVSAIGPAPQFTLNHLAATGVQVSAIGNFDTSPTGQIDHYWMPATPQSTNYYKGPYPYRGAHNFAAFDALPYLIQASADLTVDTRYHCRMRAVYEDGMISAPVFLRVDVGDPT